MALVAFICLAHHQYEWRSRTGLDSLQRGVLAAEESGVNIYEARIPFLQTVSSEARDWLYHNSDCDFHHVHLKAFTTYRLWRGNSTAFRLGKGPLCMRVNTGAEVMITVLRGNMR